MTWRMKLRLSKPQVPFLVAFVAGLIVPPIILLAIALSGWLSVEALSFPPQWESKIGQMALEASLARRSVGLANPISGSEADLLAGMKAYRDDCSGCHGDYGQHKSGHGLYPPAPQFVQRPPDLTAPEMFIAAKYGIRYTGMGAWNKEDTDQEIWEAVTFLSKLNSLPPAVREGWEAKH